MRPVPTAGPAAERIQTQARELILTMRRADLVATGLGSYLVGTLMRTLTLCLSTLTLALCCAGLAWASPPVRGAQLPAAGALTEAQQHYLSLARTGVTAAQRRWRDRRLGWYDSRLDDHERYPLATIWDSVPLFESLDAIAIAQPTGANRRAVARFAAGAERYLNRGLRPVPGYSPYPGDREPNTETWFDDNGWWGIALVIEQIVAGRHGTDNRPPLS
jgi:hypothetical protein